MIIDNRVLVTFVVLLLLSCLLSGMGIPVGDQFPAGNGDGRKNSPDILRGDGVGDGGSIPNGEFTIAILNQEPCSPISKPHKSIGLIYMCYCSRYNKLIS